MCIWHILSGNAWTSLSMRSVSPEHSLLSHIHKTSVIFYQSLLRQALECVQSRQSVDYSRPCTKWANIWHFLDKPYHACILVRAFTALTHAQKWVTVYMAYSISQCSDKTLYAFSLTRAVTAPRPCTKWVYIWHILSVNGHLRLNMGAALPEPLLLIH